MTTFVMLLLSATAVAKGDSSIVEALKQQKKGAVVKVHQSEALTALMIRDTSAMDERLVPGYRIQIFSSNIQRGAREMAHERAKTINQSNPELSVYVTFNSPFWRVRVGNYSSYEEATIKLRELKKSYPTFQDMRIVKDNIVETY